jgi:hypothetical protein
MKKRIVVLFTLFVCFCINAFADSVCNIIDANGKLTRETIYVSVTKADGANGKVTLVVSSDSNQYVNANISINVNGKYHDSQLVQVSPNMSGEKIITIKKWPGNAKVTADITSAKCQK